MNAVVREWLDESRAPLANMTTTAAASAQHEHVAAPDAADTAAASSAAATAPSKKSRKVSPVLEPEDDAATTNEDDGEVDETFLALQKLLINMEGMRRSQVTPVSAHVVHTSTGTSTGTGTGTGTGAARAASREELLESRRREREQFRLLLLSKGSNSNGNSTGNRRRRPTHYCVDDDDDDDESPAPSVESTISNRMMNGSFSRYSVHAISRERWAREETERLPLVLLPKDGKVSSPADNPKLNVMHTAEYIDLSEQLDARLQSDGTRHEAYHLTPPRSTWCIQMRDFDALQC